MTLAGTGTRQRDQLGQIAITVPVLRQRNQCHRCRLPLPGDPVELKISAHQQFQFALFSCDMGAYDAGQRTLIGDGKRLITERIGARHQFFGMRGTAQKTEIGETE